MPIEGFEMPDPPTMLYASEVALMKDPFSEMLRQSLQAEGAEMMPASGMLPYSQKLFTSEELLASKYVPEELPASPALVLVLHGCRQHSQGYAEGAGWIALADKWKFVLVCPQQTYRRNILLALQWFLPQKNEAGWQEGQTIMQMVDRVAAEHGVDPKRVYVTGLSAGGAMTALMLAMFPERFAGGGINAGLPYMSAMDTKTAFDVMKNPTDVTPERWAELVRGASNYGGPWPRVSIWHGDADETVNCSNMRGLMEQWTAVHGVREAPDAETFKGQEHKIYCGRGEAVVETYLIHGMDHGTAVDPGTDVDQGGDPDAAGWIYPVGIFSSYYTSKFWGLAPL
jgi:poly(hydroxyalkanoate) depolymerase family esterase